MVPQPGHFHLVFATEPINGAFGDGKTVSVEKCLYFQASCAFRFQSENDDFEAFQHGGLFARRSKLLHSLNERVLKSAFGICQTLTHVSMTRPNPNPS